VLAQHFFTSGELTSFKKILAIENTKRTYVAMARHGKKYGYLPQKGCEKRFGQRSCGRDSTPPMKGLGVQILAKERMKEGAIYKTPGFHR
jgi:hypothetical protein